MSSFRLKRFSNSSILKRIEPELLMQFLYPYRAFLVNRQGLAWPCNPEEFDHVALAKILMSPSVDTPDELLDALYFVDGLTDVDSFDRILQEAQDAGIDLGEQAPTPEDLTLRVWLVDRNILERVDAEQKRVYPKKFKSYFSTDFERLGLCFSVDFTREMFEALEVDLNDWFDFKKKGRGAKVFSFPEEDGFWFLVRHGQHIKREGTVEIDGDPGSVFYRPEKFDVLIYYPETGELAIYASTKGEHNIYCKLFGKHLFGDAEFFDFTNIVEKYTLQPLIDDARASLTCSDVDGIESINLYELHIGHHNDQKDIEIRRADDVFQALEYQHRYLESEREHTTILRAKFKVTFSDGRKRSVTIEPPNTGTFDRETDNSVIHEWLTKRGFIPTLDVKEEHENSEAVLAMV